MLNLIHEKLNTSMVLAVVRGENISFSLDTRSHFKLRTGNTDPIPVKRDIVWMVAPCLFPPKETLLSENTGPHKGLGK